MAHSSPIRRAIAICLVVATCALCAYGLYFAVTRDVQRIAATFASAIQGSLNLTPRITVDRTLVFKERTPVLELTSTKHHFHHRMRWSSTWMNSTKEIELSGEFTASIGFDLHEEFSVAFDSRSRSVRVRLPKARVLAVELDSLQTNQDSGWWNSVTDADRTLALNAFTADARTQAQKAAPALAAAEADLREQVAALLAPSGFKIAFDEPAIALPTPAESSPASP